MENRQAARHPRIPTRATIRIRDLRLRTYIGFNPEEKAKQQDVVINVEIDYALDPGALEDRVEDALDYKVITKRIIRHVEDGRFLLLEKLVADLLALCSEPTEVWRARVTVDKPHALRFADSVSLSLEYHADENRHLKLLEKAS
jgi:D-erythro-7,8-dihydroneopterin triphosphate epimerase